MYMDPSHVFPFKAVLRTIFVPKKGDSRRVFRGTKKNLQFNTEEAITWCTTELLANSAMVELYNIFPKHRSCAMPLFFPSIRGKIRG